MLTDHPAAGLDPAVLAAETDRLLDFGVNFPHPDGGSVWLGDAGQPDLGRPVLTYITARMAHVYALGVGLGRPAAARLTDAALAGLTGRLHDDRARWLVQRDQSGRQPRRRPSSAMPTPSWCSPRHRPPWPVAPARMSSWSRHWHLWQERFFDTDAGHVRRRLGPDVHHPRPLSGGQRQHARRRSTAGRRRRHRKPGPARAGRWPSPSGSSSSSPSRVSGGSPNTSRPPGSRCSSTTGTSRTIPSSRTGRRSVTGWSGPGCSCISRRHGRPNRRIGAGVAATRRREPLRPGGRRRLVRRRTAWLRLHDRLGRGAGRRRPDALGHRRGRIGSRGSVPADRRTPVRRTRTDLVGVRRGAPHRPRPGFLDPSTRPRQPARRTRSGRANPTSTTPSRRH